VNPVIVISDRDNVATALETLEPGTSIHSGDHLVTVVERIPRGHKVAIRGIARGEAVMKYGSAIGTAAADIGVGAHVHIHNVASARGRGDLGTATSDRTQPARLAEPPDGGAP
jgi:altronate dehydratase